MRASRRRLVALVALLLAVAAGVSAGGASSAPAVTIELGSADAGVNALRVGVTHTQHSIDPRGSRTAIASARELLRGIPMVQNQHIMGWGAGNPQPLPGRYDWRSLDARVQLMRTTGGDPMITLAVAPDWMKGGLPGTTNWSRIEAAPTVGHFDDFARLAQQVALRYPDVRYFQVWNELKGFWDRSKNRWRYEDYTRLYNAVYDAVKEVRPDALVGGPYVVVDSWSSPKAASHPSSLAGPWGVADQRSLDVISYWLANARGADFVALDASTKTKDGGLVTDPFTASRKFADVNRWVRARTDLPIVWSEWRPSADSSDPRRQLAIAAEGLVQTATSGASAVLWWQPQGVGTSCTLCLWTDTRRLGGGRRAPAYDLVQGFGLAFPPGARWVVATSSSPTVGVLATSAAALLVNRTARTLTVSGVAGVDRLAPYEVRFVAR
ncbi:MAG TPA: hypothetical protein VFV35_01450 [Acidimicrobiales bacterium]|nr:hypothetical protein [Acidimicrobiales bacterium]